MSDHDLERDEPTETNVGRAPPEDYTLRPCLEVLESADATLLGQVIPVGDGLVVGRGDRSTLRVMDRSVSREHARMFVLAGQVALADLGSTNGTYVNGVRIQRAVLQLGDMVRIGLHTTFRFSREAARWSLRLTDALLAARIALWEWDSGTGAFRASRNFSGVTGVDQEEVPTDPAALLALVHPDDRTRVEEAARALYATAGSVETEVRFNTPDGRELWLGLKAQVTQIGSRFAVTGSAVNVTARKRAEREMRRLTLVLENMYDAIVVLDLDGRITDWTSRAAATFALSRDEALGTAVSDLVGAAHFSALQKEVAERGHYTDEIPVSRQSGVTGVYEVAAAPLRDDDGWIVGFVAAFRDVTARKALQEQLIVSDKMAAIGTLAAGIAHEINNPLAFVAGGLDWLAERIGPLSAALEVGDPAEVREVLGEMRQGVSRIATIVGSLKTFSRRDDEPAIGPVQLAQVVKLAERIVANEVRHVAQLRIEVPDDLYVRGNETRLMQVFINLLVNAAHAIQAGDHSRNSIEIRLVGRRGGAAEVTVRDTGAGMTPEVLERAFHPFFTTKPASKGTGLGLSVTRTILESSGGDIHMESQPGAGTCVRLTLPLAAADGQAAPAPAVGPSASAAAAAAAARRRAGVVLVIDDEPMVAKALCRLLESRGYEALAAGDGAAGIDLALCGDFDVILCDLMMPDVSGVDVHDRLMLERPDLAERMIFVSGGAFTSREQSFVEEGHRRVLTKPWSPDTLLAAICEVKAAGARGANGGSSTAA